MRSGQTMLEYVIAFTALLAVIGVLWALVSLTMRYAVRSENLVSSEYP